jgi:polysaccharide pyruvyl transferase WcaK-like protein
LWRLYRKVYEAVDFVALREPESFGLMSHAGISAVESFDCLPLYIARHFTTSGSRRDEIVVAGSVALRESDVAAWTAFAERVKARGTALRVLIGASMLPAADDAEFVRRLVRESPDAWEVVEADRMEQWLDTLARAAVVVSGRFHHTIAAATLGTPFVLLESNTQKNAGLASVLGAPPPKPLDAADLVEQLVAGVDSARAPRADLAAELCAAAMRNFLRLPPLG